MTGETEMVSLPMVSGDDHDNNSVSIKGFYDDEKVLRRTEEGNVEVTLKRPADRALREDLSADLLMATKWVRLYMLVVWVGATILMGVYFSEIIYQYIASVNTPSSTVLYQSADRLPLPTVVVCNWNQNGNLQNPVPPPNQTCPECELFLDSCQNLNTSADCTSEWAGLTVQTDAGLFYCWQFNNDPVTVTWSNTTGYSGSYATVWRINLFPATDPPQNRAGLQVSFFPNDDGTSTVDPTLIYNEVRFAQPDFDSFYALTYVTTIHNELSTDDPNFNTSRFDYVVSSVALLQPNDNATAYVGVSFSFQTLSQEIISFDIAYTLNNLFGDFASMIGTLMGLDTIKVSSGIPLAWLAVKLRSLSPIEDHFN